MEPRFESATAPDPRHLSYTQVMYLLHAIAVAIGILTAASIVGNFLVGLPSIIAVVMNYVRRDEVRGTWLESHFRWQLRTFWWALFWVLVALVLFGWLVLIFIGIPLLIASFFLIGVWVAYRVARGWLALNAGRPMPV